MVTGKEPEGALIFEQTMNKERPLSPHLQIYRLPLCALLSIFHRITGVILTVGFLVFVIWLYQLTDSDYPKEASVIFTGIFFKILLLGWAFAFFYHLGNGLRHLVWDAGKGFEKSQIELGGMIVIFATLILTAIYAFLVIF